MITVIYDNCERLKDVKDTPDASLKTGSIKDAKQRLPTKYLSNLDALQQSLMT